MCANVSTLLFVVSLMISESCTTFSKNARTYSVKRDSKGNHLSSDLQDTHCYQFTWVGPENKDTNNITSCNQLWQENSDNMPCFEPLVWTNGTFKHNRPDLKILERKCAEVGNTEGEMCVPLCRKKATNSCAKMTYYNRDKEQTVAYETHFCGIGMDVTDDKNTILEEGCHRQYHKNATDYDVEACFCVNDRCNMSANTMVPYGAAILCLQIYLLTIPYVLCM